MFVINARNVNEALPIALREVKRQGEYRNSRNGEVLGFMEPVATVYSHPTERVLFSPVRNANPTFHLLESLWMLAGRNDTKFPATIVKNMKNFSDDGETLWGAYGHRWRQFFGWDQIDAAVEELRVNPDSRRVVLSMWNAMDDSGIAFGAGKPDFIVGLDGGKDVPCNTHIYFDRRGGKLNMTVCCRSNDILWGCYGANAVHMSVLQEYMALSIGCEVGTYTQMSNDLHLYTATIPKAGLLKLEEDCRTSNVYMNGVSPVPLWGANESRESFDRDVRRFFIAFDREGHTGPGGVDYETGFFDNTVKRMLRAWSYRKVRAAALREVDRIVAEDWHYAMKSWIITNQPYVPMGK